MTPHRRTVHACLAALLAAPLPEQFATQQSAEFAKWKPVIETGKITAD